MVEATTEPGLAQSVAKSNTLPYAPSWIDRLSRRIDSLRGPTWAYYLGLWAAIAALQTLVRWVDGTHRFGEVDRLDVLTAGLPVYILASLRYISRLAGRQLEKSRPVLVTDAPGYEMLKYRLTVVPARDVWVACPIAALAVVIIILTTDSYRRHYDVMTTNTPLSGGTNIVLFFIAMWTGLALVYQILRQLRIVREIFARYTRIDLYEAESYYALSRLTAITALIFAIPTYVWLATSPSNYELEVNLRVAIAYTIGGLGIFTWPLLGLHNLLDAEKDRLLTEASGRLKAVSAELHQRVDNGNLESVQDLKLAMEALVIEKTDLQKISTWPWQPETARWLLTALLLPVVLWITQRVLERLLAI